MTTQVLTSKDFNWLELLKVRVQNLASAPSTPQPGWVYFDTTLGKLRVCTNATGPVWVNLDGSDIPDSTITSAKIANGTIVDGDIASGAAIAIAKLALDPTLRSNHSGSQTASTISDLASVVKAYLLSEFGAPTAAVSLNSQKITNLADPTVDTDGANKRYVDAARAGMNVKEPVRVASTANLTLSGTQTIDGVAVQAGDRVLAKDQTTSSARGIYVVAAGAWTRATDADAFAELQDGAIVWVREGTANANTQWVQTATLTALTDAQTWVQFGAGAGYTAGNGLTLSGSDFNVGAGTGISVAADAVAIDTAVVARKFTAQLTGSATSYAITHSLANQWVTAQVFRNSSPFDLVEGDIELTDANTVTIRFAVAPTSNAYRVVVTG